jgi:hypothetical protein
LQFCDNLCPHLCTRARQKARRPHYPPFGRLTNHMRRCIYHLDSHSTTSFHLIFYLDSHPAFSIAIGCLSLPTFYMPSINMYTSSHWIMPCIIITRCILPTNTTHDHICNVKFRQLDRKKRAISLFLLVVNIAMFIKPSSYCIHHRSIPIIIVARGNAGTLGVQGSGFVSSFHHVVDIAQKLVPRCLIPLVRWVRIEGRDWLGV